MPRLEQHTITHQGRLFSLHIAKAPLTMEWLYRLAWGAESISLFEYVRIHQDKPDPYLIGEDQIILQALTTDKDIVVSQLNGQSIHCLFSDYIEPILGFRPQLITPEQLQELFLSQEF